VIDSHTHLDHGPAPEDELVAAAREAGVKRILTIGMDEDGNRAALAAAERFDEVFASVGRHPNAAHDFADAAAADLAELARHDLCRAVGETGLDYYRDWATKEDQHASFRAHIEIAKRTGKALVIHDRDAHDDVLKVLAEVGAPPVVVFHSFSGDPEMAKKCAEAGYFMSFSGPVTYKNASSLREAARVGPTELMLVETDAPYLPPVPYRGKPNAPYLIPLTLRCLAEVKGVHPDELCEAISVNGVTVFGEW